MFIGNLQNVQMFNSLKFLLKLVPTIIINGLIIINSLTILTSWNVELEVLFSHFCAVCSAIASRAVPLLKTLFTINNITTLNINYYNLLVGWVGTANDQQNLKIWQ